MIIHEDLSRLDDIYCAISSLERRLALKQEHLLMCKTDNFNWVITANYLLTQQRNIDDNKKAIERLKQTAKKELTRLLEELK